MPAAPPSPQPGFNRKFLLGLGIGLIPLLVAMIGLGQVISSSRGGPANSFLSSLLIIGGILYLAEIIAMIVLLVIRRTRPIGYGLLTMVVISPIVFAVGCFALFSAIPSHSSMRALYSLNSMSQRR
jgi:hypothetical protein